MNIEDKIRNLLEEEINKNGYKLDEVVYEKKNNTNFLRLVIDNNDVITVDDCVKVSDLVNPILDSNDPIDERYILDICSKEKGND